MKDICKKSFIYSLGAAAWIVLVATFMRYANHWFPGPDSIVTGIAALLLFSISALIIGGLLVGNPIFLYIDGKKKEAIKMLLSNAGWMMCFLIIAIIALATTK